MHASTVVCGSNLASGNAIVIHFVSPDISRLFNSVLKPVLSFELAIVNLVYLLRHRCVLQNFLGVKLTVSSISRATVIRQEWLCIHKVLIVFHCERVEVPFHLLKGGHPLTE